MILADPTPDETRSGVTDMQHRNGVTVTTDVRRETDSLGVVEMPADKLWRAQSQRSLEYFSIGPDLMPRELITAYATLKEAAANANHEKQAAGRSALQPVVFRSGVDTHFVPADRSRVE